MSILLNHTRHDINDDTMDTSDLDDEYFLGLVRLKRLLSLSAMSLQRMSTCRLLF